MTINDYIEKGFSLNKIMTILQIEESNVNLQKLDSTCEEEDLIKLKQFVEDYKEIQGVEIGQSALNDIIKSINSEKNVITVENKKVLLTLTRQGIKKFVSGWLAGVDMSGIKEKTAPRDIEYYAKFKKENKDYNPLIGREFTEDQLESICKNYVEGYDYSKIDKNTDSKLIASALWGWKRGIDVIEELKTITRNKELFAEYAAKGINIRPYIKYTSGQIQYILQWQNENKKLSEEKYKERYEKIINFCDLKYSASKITALMSAINRGMDEKKFINLTKASSILNVSSIEDMDTELCDAVLKIPENTLKFDVCLAICLNAKDDIETKKELVQIVEAQKYSAIQLETIIKYVKNPDYKVLVKNCYSAEQLGIIAGAIKKNKKIDTIANPKIECDVMRSVLNLEEKGIKVDISEYIKNREELER